jgi:hypothetical protein
LQLKKIKKLSLLKISGYIEFISRLPKVMVRYRLSGWHILPGQITLLASGNIFPLFHYPNAGSTQDNDKDDLQQ